MDFDKLIKKRATIKNYLNKKIEENKILNAIEAASLAPSPGNLSILKFIIIEDEEKIYRISQACQQDFIKNAPVIVVVCSNPKKINIMYDKRTDKYVQQHTGSAIENFLLKITDMGLVSCWVGAFSETTIKNLLKIPEEINVEVVLPIAYPSKIDQTKQKPKPDLGNILYFETWKNKYKNEIKKIGNH